MYTSQPGSLDYYKHADWEGSARFFSTPTQTMWGDVAYGPYGEIYGPKSGTYTFTGQIQERSYNNLYRFMYREYGTQGRWPSPDPAGTAAANPANPQSWNRYAYALSNPLLFVDPSRLLTCFVPLSDGSHWEIDDTTADACSGLDGTPGSSDATVTVNGVDGGDPYTGVPIQSGGGNEGGGSARTGPSGSPQSQAQRQQGFNQCVAQAAQTEHHALANSIAEESAGGLGILFSIGTGAASFEVAGEELASKNFFTYLSGAELTSRLTSIYSVKALLFGGLYVKGISDTTNALNQYDSSVAGCQAQFGYPNVP